MVRLFIKDCSYCGPVVPILEQLYDEMQEKLAFADLDCDANAQACKALNPPGYPCLFLWNGAKLIKHTGDRTKHVLRFWLEEQLRPTSFVPVASREEAAGLAEAKGQDAYFLVQGRAYPHALEYYRGRHPFYYIASDAETALWSVRDGFFYSYSGPIDSGEELRRFIRDGRRSHVIELNESTFFVFAHKQTVVLLVDPARDLGLVRQLRKDAPGKLGPDSALAYMDGVRWAEFLSESFGVAPADLPLVVRFDPEEEKEYSLRKIDGRPVWEVASELLVEAERKNATDGSGKTEL